MAHLSLQLGAAAVVRFWPRRATQGGRNWPLRVLREAAAAGPDGGPSRKHHRRGVSPFVPARRRVPAETAGE
jgi:hypothetical protein